MIRNIWRVPGMVRDINKDELELDDLNLNRNGCNETLQRKDLSHMRNYDTSSRFATGESAMALGKCICRLCRAEGGGGRYAYPPCEIRSRLLPQNNLKYDTTVNSTSRMHRQAWNSCGHLEVMFQCAPVIVPLRFINFCDSKRKLGWLSMGWCRHAPSLRYLFRPSGLYGAWLYSYSWTLPV